MKSIYSVPVDIALRHSAKYPNSQTSALATIAAHVARVSLLFIFIIGLFGIGTIAANGAPITVTNVPNNHYRYGYLPSSCPTGWNIPPGQWPSTNWIERPHVIHNDTTGQWVMWAHFEGSGYTVAQAIVLTSTSECGPYYVATQPFQPQGFQSRDENIFKDTDGTAYFITASNDGGGANRSMAIFKMTADYLNVDTTVPPTWVFQAQYREAPAVIKSGGTYFLFTSQAAGWFPSQCAYATSTSMLSGWSALKNVGNPSTFGGQLADIVTVTGTATTSYLMALDHLSGSGDSGSMLLPIIVNGAAQTATMDWATSFQVDMTTGGVTLPSNPNVALGGVASASSTAATSSPAFANDGDYSTKWVANTGTWPAWWMVDMGSPRTIEEVNISWYMVKGSESFYQYKIDYSNDGVTWSTIDRTSNVLYGFTSDSVNFSARYVKIELVQPSVSWYTPQLWEVQLLQAPSSLNLPVTITATPSATTVPAGQSFTMTVAVSGGGTNPTPTGKVTLTGPGYTSDTFGLKDGSATFTIPAYAMNPGYDTITATYIPDPTSAPTYGIAPTSTTTPVITYGFGTPALLSRYQPATASSYQSGNVPGNGNDGTTATRWTAADGTFPQWWRVDLGSVLPLTQVVTNWYSSGGRAYQYTIDASTDGINYTTVIDNTANATSGTTTDNLSTSARYVRVTVTGVTPAGGFAAFWECKVYGTLQSPPAPTGLAATAVSSGEIDLSWTDAAGTGNYNVYRGTASGGPYSLIAAGIAAASYADKGLTANTTYYYVVTAENIATESPYSNQASGTTSALLLSQGKPATASTYQTGNIPSNGNDGSLTTRWTASSGSYPQWWKVDLGGASNVSQAVINWYNTDGRVYKYQIETSNDDVTYTLKVDKTGNTVAGTTTDSFSATARYVRITATGCSIAGKYAAFWECQISGN